jgi:hypothetical protein
VPTRRKGMSNTDVGRERDSSPSVEREKERGRHRRAQHGGGRKRMSTSDEGSNEQNASEKPSLID